MNALSKKKLIVFLPFIFIFVFSIFYTSKIFYKDFLLKGEENGFLNYDFVNYRCHSLWDTTTNFGYLSTCLFNVFTLGTIWKIGRLIGLTLWQCEFLFFFVMIYLTCLFAYLAFYEICKAKIMSLLLALSYVTTYFRFAATIDTPKSIHFAILPIGTFFWLKYSQTRQIRYLTINILMLIFLLGIAANLPQMLGAYSFIFIYILLFLTKKNDLKTTAVFLLPYIFIIFFVFIINYIVMRNNTLFSHSHLFNIQLPFIDSRLRDIYRFFGGWWDYEGSNGIPYNHLLYFYHSFFGKIITYIPFFTVIFLLLKNKNKSLKLRLLCLFLLFVFFAKGTTSPFGFIFNNLIKINYFKIFREPWAKFIPNIIFIVFLSIAYLCGNLPIKFKYLTIALLTSLMIFQSIPLLTGKIVDHINKDWRILDIKVPQYWLDFHDWTVKNAQDARILVLPSSQTQPHLWEPHIYYGDPETYFTYTNIVTNRESSVDGKIVINNYFNNLSPNLISLGSIDYVLFKRDIAVDQTELKLVKEALDINKKISFGLLDIYPVKHIFYNDKIIAATKIDYSPSNCDLQTIATSPNYSKNAVFIKTKTESLPQIETTDIAVNKINNLTYKIDFIKPVTKNIGLFFSEIFDYGWKVYDTNNLFSRPVVKENDHYPANCLMNFWIVNKNIVNAKKTLFIKFKPTIENNKQDKIYTLPPKIKSSQFDFDSSYVSFPATNSKNIFLNSLVEKINLAINPNANLYYALKNIAILTKWGSSLSFNDWINYLQNYSNLVIKELQRLSKGENDVDKLLNFRASIKNHELTLANIILYLDKSTSDKKIIYDLYRKTFNYLLTKISQTVPIYNPFIHDYSLEDINEDNDYGIYTATIDTTKQSVYGVNESFIKLNNQIIKQENSNHSNRLLFKGIKIDRTADKLTLQLSNIYYPVKDYDWDKLSRDNQFFYYLTIPKLPEKTSYLLSFEHHLSQEALFLIEQSSPNNPQQKPQLVMTKILLPANEKTITQSPVSFSQDKYIYRLILVLSKPISQSDLNDIRIEFQPIFEPQLILEKTSSL